MEYMRVDEYQLCDTDETDKEFNKNGGLSRAPSTQRIVNGEDDQMEIIGFRLNKSKYHLTWFFYVITAGLVRLFFHWYPQAKLHATHDKCSLDVAEKVMIVDTYKSKFKSFFAKDVCSRTAHLDSKEDIQNSIKGATTILEKDKLVAHLENGKILELLTVRTFKCKKMVYVWDPEEKLFLRLVGLDFSRKNSDYHSHNGMSEREQKLKKIIYGPNEINIPVQGILTLLVLEALTPFYIFQVFSVLLWVAENYFYYGIAIVIMSVYGISSSIIQTRTNQKNLKGTVFSEDTVTVCRGGDIFEEIRTADLVPGDLIAIPSEGCNMQCDAILLKGNCIVNESMLTGESVPVHKTPLPNNDNLYRVKEDSNHTLFCGTTILQTKYCGHRETLAVVIRTGYMTTKGELVKSILYPPPADFKFDQDSYKFIGILSVIAVLGFIYTIITKSKRNLPFWDIAIKALDLITIAIPPALPAAMTVGKLYALGRLKKKNIYCINSRVINVSGSIDCVCFDKTGTLTEDELDMWGILPVVQGNIEAPVKHIGSITINTLIFKGMLTCHSLSIIDGKLCGYPLDLKMFNSTEWHYAEPDIKDCEGRSLIPKAIVYSNERFKTELDYKIEIFEQFPFVSSLQRSSVICRDCKEDSNFEVYCKGSPETIISLSKPETIPDDILSKLKLFTTKGYRVIAMGMKIVDFKEDEIHKVTREQIENNLTFLGLIVLENRLKVETPSAIATLKNAGMKITMITGDNIQTAVSVGKDCGIIEKDCFIIEVMATYSPKEGPKLRYYLFDTDYYQSRDSLTENVSKLYDPEVMYDRYQFVLTGKSWSNIVEYFPNFIPDIVTKGVIFSRMSACQKPQLIEALKNLGYYVAMCGDGANDCAALKAAHLGISLSEAEASIAAPFTSKDPNISCVPKVIREGRAALLTSFGVFKFMVCGTLAEFFCTIILYGIDCNLSSMQFLFIDIFLQLNLASFFGNTEACEELYHKPPLTSLLSFVPLVSMVVFMFQTVTFQLFSFYFIRTFSWYEAFLYTPHLTVVSKCQENYSTFVITMFQYISMAIIFSKGRPYRQPIYTNKIFTFLLFLTTFLCSYITLYPPLWLINILEMKMPPEDDVRWQLLAIALLNFTLVLIVEEFLIDILLDKIILPWFKRNKTVKIKEEDVKVNRDWFEGSHKKTLIQKVNERKNKIFNHNNKEIVTRC